MLRSLTLVAAFGIVFALLESSADGGVNLTAVIGPHAPHLERLAAEELKAQFQRLFGIEVKISNAIPEDKSPVVLIGSPRTNPAVAEKMDDWPQMSEQGLLIRSLQNEVRQSLVVGGGSPVATLWAVYELGHRNGIRYLTRGDIYPNGERELQLNDLNIVMEPTLRTRTWRTVNDFAIGPESWGLADQQRLLKQLAKMKYNRVMIAIWPWQPFVHYEFGGVKKQTATMWFGERFRVDGDTPGKDVFQGATYFENPDLAGKTSYEEMTAAGTTLIQGIVKAAQGLGMEVGLAIYPAEFTREFASAIPGSKEVHQLKRLTVGPGPKQGPNDSLLKELVTAKIRAYIDTYPTIDAIYMGMPEFPEWDEHVESAWQQLGEGGRLRDITLAGLIETVKKRNVTNSGERGVRALRGNIAPLVFFRSLFSDPELMKRADGRHVQLWIQSIDPALFPVIDQVVPEGAGTLNFIDYTSLRSVENRELIADLPAGKIRSKLVLTLADDNIGILPQSTTKSIHELMTDMRKFGWDGFSTRYWMLTELDPTLHYMSRASFDASVTPRSAHDDLFLTITGNAAATNRLWLAFEHMEAATDLMDKRAIGFGFPVPGMMMKHYRPGPHPDWWEEVTEHYTQWMIEVYRALVAAEAPAQPLLFYYGKRSEFAMDYLGCVTALREAATAKQKGDLELAVEKLEVAVEAMYNSIDSLSHVVWDQSDRGLIATLANFAYRPLVAEYEKMLEQVESN